MTYSASITLTEAELLALRDQLRMSWKTHLLRKVLAKCEEELAVLTQVAEDALKAA